MHFEKPQRKEVNSLFLIVETFQLSTRFLQLLDFGQVRASVGVETELCVPISLMDCSQYHYFYLFFIISAC